MSETTQIHPDKVRAYMATAYRLGHTAQDIVLTTQLSVYYAGFSAASVINVEWSDGSTESLPQDIFFSIMLRKQIEAKGFAWAALS